MTPTVLVELGPEAIRQPRRFVLFGQVTLRTGRAGGAAGAGVFAFPWSIGMALTHPAAILAHRAFHGLPSYPGLLPRIILRSNLDHASRAKGGWSDPARVVRTHRASGRFFPAEIRADVGAFPAASLAGEPRLYIGQPNVIRPPIGAHRGEVAARIVGAVDQDAANA